MLTWIVTLLMLAIAAGQAHAQTPAPRKVAVVVGSNAAPAGRRLLRYTHDDARSVQQVLSSVGGFAAQDVHVLLDPTPADVLAQLDQEIAALGKAAPDALLLFYYSGHADEHALYPGGRALDFAQLRKRLDNEAVGVRVGIIDSCRGGAWTGTRGLSESEAFAVNVPMQLANEGSVLISSSSGLEDAHESSQLEGGFFTHYWNAGLRGAGDRNGDLTVTLTEAFDYARGLTIRDTAIHTQSAQHPSYRMNLRGQHDLALAQLSSSPTALSLSQDRGPMQLIGLDRGLMLLEIPAGKRSVRLSVPPGRYLVRVGADGQTRAHELEVKAGSAVTVAENELELIGSPELARRSFEPRPVSASTVPDGMWEIAFALGVQHGVKAAGLQLGDDDQSDVGGLFRVAHGFSDRLQWQLPLPAFAYRGGDAGGFEWIPWGGLLGFKVSGGTQAGVMTLGHVAAGVDLRWWMGSLASVQLTLGAASNFQTAEHHASRYAFGPTTWQVGALLGYSYFAGEAVTLSIAAGYAQYVLFEGGLPQSREQWQPLLLLGSVQSVALRQLPLVRVHLGDVVSLDGYAALTFDFAHHSTEETYMLGATFIW